jgi:hypothetical protein
MRTRLDLVMPPKCKPIGFLFDLELPSNPYQSSCQMGFDPFSFLELIFKSRSAGECDHARRVASPDSVEGAVRKPPEGLMVMKHSLDGKSRPTYRSSVGARRLPGRDDNGRHIVYEVWLLGFSTVECADELIRFQVVFGCGGYRLLKSRAVYYTLDRGTED